MIVIFKFMHFFCTMTDGKNTESVIKYQQLRWSDRRENGKTKHWVQPFFHYNLNS
jgi:hypothetical protein